MKSFNSVLAEQIFDEATTNKTSARMIRSSIHVADPNPWFGPTRLDSIYGIFPKMVMGERNRHRSFSLSDRSSRAVPPEKLIAEIRSGVGLAMPAKFRKRVSGMGGGEELIGDELLAAQMGWIIDALDSADAAERAMLRGEEKETVNRRLDMYIYLHTLQTGTRDAWLNYLGLRLANASPTIELFAAKCFEVYKATKPLRIRPGSWHLPFVDEAVHSELPSNSWIDLSAARCAHLSFNDLETGERMTLERALRIAGRLRDSHPLHASPFEHQATPDEFIDLPVPSALELDSKTADIIAGRFDTIEDIAPLSSPEIRPTGWQHLHQHGNLPGWRQARKMIPGEAVAPLPAGWEL